MSTYAQLKSDIATWAVHSDIPSVVGTLVRLAEVRIRDLIRCRDMEASTTLTASSQATSLPADFLQLRSIHLDATYHRKLEYVTPETGYSRAYQSEGGPCEYSIQGNSLLLFPAPSQPVDVKLLYFKAYAPLVNDLDTNWLLQNYYSVYLYGALAEAKGFIEDDEQAAKWLTQFERECERVNMSASRGRVGTSLRRKSDAP